MSNWAALQSKLHSKPAAPPRRGQSDRRLEGDATLSAGSAGGARFRAFAGGRETGLGAVAKCPGQSDGEARRSGLKAGRGGGRSGGGGSRGCCSGGGGSHGSYGRDGVRHHGVAAETNAVAQKPHRSAGAAAGAGAAPPLPFHLPSPHPPLLEPGMTGYEDCVEQCYRGFVHSRSQHALSPSLLERVSAALESLRRQQLFHHDVVLAPHKGQPTPTPTVVQRILVGEPGITYKYLGLRTFAHPWSGHDIGATAALRELNLRLIASTAQLLARGLGGVRSGSCEYNLTLVNLLMPTDARGGALRNRAGARLGGPASEQAVSWHADSAVEDFSSIAVLNLLLPPAPRASAGGERRRQPAGKRGGRGQPWRIAMKCVGDGHEPSGGDSNVGNGGSGGSGGTPAIAVPLVHGDAYFMLGDFNHLHHHAVLAGSSGRYSSTHRVGVTETDTWEYIWARCEAALETSPPRRLSANLSTPPTGARNSGGGGGGGGGGDDRGTGSGASGGSGGRGGGSGNRWASLSSEALWLCEEVHTELEAEWLRPWAAQGAAHARQHALFWRPKMAQLHEVWQRLEARTAAHIALLVETSAAPAHVATATLPEGSRCFDMLEHLLLQREGHVDGYGGPGRAGWKGRLRAKAYAQLEPDWQPFAFPEFHAGEPIDAFEPALAGLGLVMLDESLAGPIARLREAKAAFARRAAATALIGGGGGQAPAVSTVKRKGEPRPRAGPGHAGGERPSSGKRPRGAVIANAGASCAADTCIRAGSGSGVPLQTGKKARKRKIRRSEGGSEPTIPR